MFQAQSPEAVGLLVTGGGLALNALIRVRELLKNGSANKAAKNEVIAELKDIKLGIAKIVTNTDGVQLYMEQGREGMQAIARIEVRQLARLQTTGSGL